MTSSKSPRRRPRVSLMSLLLLTALVGTATSLWMLWREVGPLRVEVVRHRNELGILTVTDPALFHAMQLDSDLDYEWKWRVYVPDGASYQLEASTKTRWRNGPGREGTTLGGLLKPGQQTIAFRLVKDAGGEWLGELETKTSKSSGTVPPIDEWPSKSSRSETSFGKEQAKTHKVGESIRLFKVRIEGKQNSPDEEAWPITPFIENEVVLTPR